MASMETLCQKIGINCSKLTKKEENFLEAALFFFICEELNELFTNDVKNYLNLIKDDDKEMVMLNSNFIRSIVKDILSTEFYTLAGIAYHTQIPEDVIYEIAIGRNLNPSFELSRKIIDLHITVRKELYQKLLLKITKNIFFNNEN